MAEVLNLLDHFVKKAKTHQLLNDSILYSFLGRRRAGKSTLTLAVLKKCDPDMDTEQIVFSNEEFRKATRELSNCALFWDEPSVTAYSRDYQDEANRLLNKTLQVFGFKKLVIGLAYQHASFLDKHTRWLVDVYFICSSRIIPEELRRENFVEPRVLLTDWIREPYLAPYKINRKGRLVEVGSIPIPSLDELFEWAGISKKFYKDYEKKKMEFFEEAEWEKTEKAHKLGIDKRQLRRFQAYESCLFSLVDSLRVEGFTMKDIAKRCGAVANKLKYWLEHPIFNGEEINNINLYNQLNGELQEIQD